MEAIPGPNPHISGTDAQTKCCAETFRFFKQIAAYEREIGKLREELLKEISHLEERKEEAVRAAATCSPEHFQNLQDQFFSKSVAAESLQPTMT